MPRKGLHRLGKGYGTVPERLRNASTQKRASAVQKMRELAEEGLNLAQINKITGYNRHTVKKYPVPDFDPAFSSYGMNRPGKLKPYCGTIDAMPDEHRKFREIEAAIRDMGCHGSASTM